MKKRTSVIKLWRKERETIHRWSCYSTLMSWPTIDGHRCEAVWTMTEGYATRKRKCKFLSPWHMVHTIELCVPMWLTFCSYCKVYSVLSLCYKNISSASRSLSRVTAPWWLFVWICLTAFAWRRSYLLYITIFESSQPDKRHTTRPIKLFRVNLMKFQFFNLQFSISNFKFQIFNLQFQISKF